MASSDQDYLMPRDVAIVRIREVLADIDEDHLQSWLQTQPAGDISAQAIDFLVEASLQDGYPRKAPPAPVWKSAMEVAQRLDFEGEVEERWASELRGDAAVVAPPHFEKSENYNLHAMHTLLVQFPNIPKRVVRSTFLKAPSFHDASVRLQNLDLGDKQLKRSRVVSKMPPPPVDVPLDLAQEIAFSHARIENVLCTRREQRKERQVDLKRSGGLCTCCCCFDDELLPEEMILCDGQPAHSFCRSCVRNLAQAAFGSGLFAQNFQQACRASSSMSGIRSSSSSSAPSSSAASSSSATQIDLTLKGGVASSSGRTAFDLRMASLPCASTSGCLGCFSDQDLKLALPVKDYKRYTSRCAALQALASGLKDLVPCPGCDFIVEMGDFADEVIQCLNPECGKVSCRWCGEADHRPLRCDQVEKGAEVKLRTFLEEQMNEAIARRCPNPQCRKAYDRVEGCNKMKCPCGTYFCYLCGTVLDTERPYDHFVDGHHGGGEDNKGSRCTVFGTPAWAQQPANAVSSRAEKALQEYLEEHPELKDLGGERIRNIKRSVGLDDVPAPSRKRQRGDDDVPHVAEARAANPQGLLSKCAIQ